MKTNTMTKDLKPGYRLNTGVVVVNICLGPNGYVVNIQDPTTKTVRILGPNKAYEGSETWYDVDTDPEPDVVSADRMIEKIDAAFAAGRANGIASAQHTLRTEAKRLLNERNGRANKKDYAAASMYEYKANILDAVANKLK